jgi:hypothetical protein
MERNHLAEASKNCQQGNTKNRQIAVKKPADRAALVKPRLRPVQAGDRQLHGCCQHFCSPGNFIVPSVSSGSGQDARL